METIKDINLVAIDEICNIGARLMALGITMSALGEQLVRHSGNYNQLLKLTNEMSKQTAWEEPAND